MGIMRSGLSHSGPRKRQIKGQLQISLSVPGGFAYEEHSEWLLRSIYEGPAVQWPWIILNYGFDINKAHPELIRFVTEKVIPCWIEDWGSRRNIS